MYYAHTSLWGRQLYHWDICFILILCAFWPAGVSSPFVVRTALSFFPVSSDALSLSSYSLIKRGRKSGFSHQVYPNWTASHFSFMPLCVDQGSHMKLFVGRQHQGYLFCLVECKVNRRGRTEIGKHSRCQWMALKTVGGSCRGSIWVKRKIRGEREMRQREEVVTRRRNRREVLKAAKRERETEWKRTERTRSGTETGWTDG